MIADYFNNFDLGALVSAGHSGNTGNTTGEAPNRTALHVTPHKTADKPEAVTVGNSQRCVTDVTHKAVTAVTAVQPEKPRSDRASVDTLPLLPALPEKTPCYCCHGADYWQSRINGDSICRKCHPPAPGAERVPDKT